MGGTVLACGRTSLKFHANYPDKDINAQKHS
jgi:hypothetical protein